MIPQNFSRLTIEEKTAWNCQLCHCKKPKFGNTNTPIRPLLTHTSNNIPTPKSPIDNNATLREKLTPCEIVDDCTCIDDEPSIVDDTLNPLCSPKLDRTRLEKSDLGPIDITLEKLDILLDRKF